MIDEQGYKICLVCRSRLTNPLDDNKVCSLDCQILWRRQIVEDIIKERRRVREEKRGIIKPP